ncbi:2-oxoglutarate dehydrogenase E1 component [Paraburkholderia ginsengiterrae]|uniref:oxoglutarate dehydrogenase (succinyl-transferring) n=1 Tax=Paraburkholderia ginsengiterrae TaxID=1462993 RepID=A0A1A9NBC1_9BURK|nr:2-oxoglutarate dehydrogenase E1 component [Paraburkholderia ginsengiterrae]OAJ60134.1 2-oxoglutarate dehydrogenase E1 component [Paraburkholderia ginsengiterrae]OAJ63266.1 2-oxoglutarate dehydrogenase E1 component [Paraburkholderia ginsengiterrae]
MLMQKIQSSFLFGGNAPYVEEQYEVYLADPASVSDEWRAYFDALRETPAIDGSDRDDEPHAPVVSAFVDLGKRSRVTEMALDDGLAIARKQVAVQSLIAAFRMVGTRKAKLDPLLWTLPQALVELTPAFYGLSAADMSTRFSTADTFLFDEDATLGDIVAALEQTYSGTLGAEFMHLTDANERRWWQMRLESTRAKPSFSVAEKNRILERLTAAEGLEKYLHTRYVGQKRFSLEGGESLIVLLDELVRYGASKKVSSVVMGMAHRGRLNVLVNITGKPLRALFDEFDGKVGDLLPAGDVKYHKGFSSVTQTNDGPVDVVLAFNPSHLEIVNPVVQGMARAKGDALGSEEGSDVLPVEIHGDAAMSGQGVVMETLSLSYTRGHGTGGTVHVVVNNQVGFTTSDPRDARSSFYTTDIAKMIEAPVLHVNGDDPEAVAMAVRLALDYRTAFKRSVVIDLVCFRKYGHQEQDTPSITQPLMYRAIASHPGVRTVYARQLIQEGVVTPVQVDDYVNASRNGFELARQSETPAASVGPDEIPVWPKFLEDYSGPVTYGPPLPAQVRALARQISTIPDGYELHPLVGKMMAARREMVDGTKPIDWGMGEHLAFASLLGAGIDVRLSGQDSARGTFSHRHAVLHNQRRTSRSDGVYIPLEHVDEARGRFTVTNSILSEAAVLAFEYGYSTVNRNALVVWEAQFGDFANGAQVVIDQFIAAGAAKWGQLSGLTLFLPHGQEGQGPEHASARLERYLQLCAQDNMRVVQPTTPAQLFHLLRMQATVFDRRPLVVMTPKSLLRHPEAVSSLDDLAKGAFREILVDTHIEPSRASSVERVIVSSGKVYFDLLEHRRTSGIADTPLIRVEQLYPFPSRQLAAEFARYPNLKTVVWSQEESRNQGAWGAIEPQLREILPSAAQVQYAGPPASASTAPGYHSAHVARQAALVSSAFAM